MAEVELDRFGNERHVVTNVSVAWKGEATWSFGGKKEGIHPSVAMRAYFDLSEMSDIMKTKLAIDGLKIKSFVRDLCRTAINENDTGDLGTVKVLDADFAGKRVPKDELSIAKRAVGKMAEEEEASLLEMLLARQAEKESAE